MDFPNWLSPPDLRRHGGGIVDLFLVLIFLCGLWRGWRVGFVIGFAELACLAVGLVAAFLVTAQLAPLLADHGGLQEPWASPAVFLVTFAVAQLVLAVIVGRLLRPRAAGKLMRSTNRVTGLVPGAAHGAIQAMVAAIALTTLPLTDGITRAAQDSTVAVRLGEPADAVERWLAPIFDPAVERTMQALTVQPEVEAEERITLPFVVTNAPARPDLEATMLALVNAERAKVGGLRPLSADAETVEVSRAHGRDMFARSYFAHLSPEGRTPFDRLRAARLGFRAAGENLALARTLAMAHQGLMNSPGHRANILNPAFGRLGVGIVDGGRHGLMVTQTFRN